LLQTIRENDNHTTKEHSYIGDKSAANLLLLIVYLYNLRVVHHRLVMDILLRLTSESPVLTELRVELIVCVVENCGLSLRSDDPQGLKEVILAVQKATASSGAGASGKTADMSRVQFMTEALSDLKNNKSRRTQSAHAETVAQLRKWLGRVKASKASTGSASELKNALSVSLTDLLEAETTGRWWRAGAYWGGRGKAAAGDDGSGGADAGGGMGGISSGVDDGGASAEEQQLLKLAKKFRMNTSVRRNIFVALMSSRDVSDAFERLSRLDLKGKQDREVMRVISTCCGHEKTYNPFYAELALVFCNQNRQNRTTLQYVFWVSVACKSMVSCVATPTLCLLCNTPINFPFSYCAIVIIYIRICSRVWLTRSPVVSHAKPSTARLSIWPDSCRTWWPTS
jgi:nucleolar MIF4G domain-containing protein 1